MRTWIYGLMLGVGALLMNGCVATMEQYTDESAITVSSEVNVAQSIDVPVRFFDDYLSSRYQYNGLGIINDQETFQTMWEMYATDATALPPSIDFRDFVLIFAYDPNYYNHVSIIKLNVWQGIVNPIMHKTDWKLSIRGDEKMRKIREAKGAKLPEPKVNVSFVQVPRHRKDHPGVTALLVSSDENDPANARVIPIPEEP